MAGAYACDGLEPESPQPDARLSRILEDLGCAVRVGADWVEVEAAGRIPGFEVDAPGATHEDNVANGLYPTSDPVALARLCLSCHFGNKDKFVTHRIMGAGHPRISFELDTFTQTQPPHFVIDEDWQRRKGRWDGVRVWAIGQALAAQEPLDVVLDPKRGRDGLFPELVVFDCHGCHHPMSETRWKPRVGTRPGTIRCNDSNLLMLRQIVRRTDPEDAPAFNDLVLQLHRVAVSGRREFVVSRLPGSNEVEDRELLDVPAESVDVVITNKALDGRTLRELSTLEWARGVFATRLTRGAVGLQIPLLPETKLNRGDILRISGTRANTDRAVAASGYADRPNDVTDMVWVGLGILAGGLVGTLEIQLGPVPITLSTSGGALLAGLFIGWLRSVHPTFGRVPTPSQWFMNSVGLNMFIAVVGITSGPTFLSGLREAGITLFFWRSPVSVEAARGEGRAASGGIISSPPAPGLWPRASATC